MVSLVDLQLEIVRKFEKFRERYIENARKIKTIAKNSFVDFHALYVFGSIVTGKTHPLSDIDVAVVLLEEPKEEDRVNFYRKIRKTFGIFHPFELHVITQDEWENWYKKFVKNNYIEI